MNIKRIIKEEIEGFKDPSEEDWEWANNVDITHGLEDMAFHFDPPLFDGEGEEHLNYGEDLTKYHKLYDFLISLGVKPIFGTPRSPDSVIGLCVGNQFDNKVDGLQMVYTSYLDEDETYLEHIEGFAHRPITLIDVDTFIKDMGL